MKRKRTWRIKRKKGKLKGKPDQTGPSRVSKKAINEREMEGIDMTSMWHPCGAMWHRCGSMWHRCGSLRHRFSIDVASMWIDVASMWIDVASMWHRCGRDSASNWHRCGIDVASIRG